MAENRQYDHEYKVQAVKLAKEIRQASRTLGISIGDFRQNENQAENMKKVQNKSSVLFCTFFLPSAIISERENAKNKINRFIKEELSWIILN